MVGMILSCGYDGRIPPLKDALLIIKASLECLYIPLSSPERNSVASTEILLYHFTRPRHVPNTWSGSKVQQLMGQEVKAVFSNSLVVPIPRVLLVNASISGCLVLPSLVDPSSSRAFQVLQQLLLGRSFD